MQSTIELTPAQRTLKLIEDAKRRAERDVWDIYEDENRRQLEALRGPARKPITHGVSGYRRGCRCDDCRTAIREYQREYKARKPKAPRVSKAKGREGRTVKEWMHGTHTGYSYGCRCDECKAHHARSRPKSNTNHGTQYGYRKGCRCSSCVKAVRDARLRRAGREVKPKRTIPYDDHGTRKRYAQGCRCPKCRQANTLHMQEYRARRRNAEVSSRSQHSTEAKIKNSNMLPVEGGHNQETV